MESRKSKRLCSTVEGRLKRRQAWKGLLNAEKDDEQMSRRKTGDLHDSALKSSFFIKLQQNDQ